MNSAEYIRGEIAFFKREDCPADASEDFKDGYAKQYESEQIFIEQMKAVMA